MNKCLNCGKELIGKWQIKFCSRNCANRYNNRTKPKYCKNCKKELIGEKRKNTFCNQSCHQNYKTKVYIEKWLAGKISGNHDGEYSISKRVRNYLLEKVNYKCEKCGWGERHPITGNVPLEIDHIDGNWKNSSPENLRVLCPNCHSLTSTYGALNINKGKGHKMRGINRFYRSKQDSSS